MMNFKLIFYLILRQNQSNHLFSSYHSIINLIWIKTYPNVVVKWVIPSILKRFLFSPENYTITFDVGFIINIETVKKGGLIPTQKRRKCKRAKKTNHTIKKDRVNER
jgi:hypothetical protein